MIFKKEIQAGSIVYITKRGTKYFAKSFDKNYGLTYFINQSSKNIPIETITTAYEHHKNGIEINAKWYKNFNKIEYASRPCNLSVLNYVLKNYLT